MKKYIVILCVVLCSGCAMTAWSPLKAKEYKFRGMGIKTTIPSDWYRNNLGGKGLHISKDGMALNLISINKFKFRQKLPHTEKKYEEGMTIQDIADVTIDNIKANKSIFNFKVNTNTPITISGLDAYRFEYSYETEQGLKKKGITCGLVEGKRVYAVTYEAPRLHYYDKTLSDFESLVSSFEVLSISK